MCNSKVRNKQNSNIANHDSHKNNEACQRQKKVQHYTGTKPKRIHADHSHQQKKYATLYAKTKVNSKQQTTKSLVLNKKQTICKNTVGSQKQRNIKHKKYHTKRQHMQKSTQESKTPNKKQHRSQNKNVKQKDIGRKKTQTKR